ncbi:MAG: hypothetical protein JXO44_01695 [Clostridia bacterium]|nr:hypothetical protein [Clostridia bacterium]
MDWTRPNDIKEQLQKRWDSGAILASLADDVDLFPLQLTLKRPTSKELSERFSEVQSWISELSKSAKNYRIEFRHVNHRILGPNEVPSKIYIDQLSDALVILCKQKQARVYVQLLEQTRKEVPVLVQWLIKRPLRALEVADVWTELLSIVQWVLDHPRPAIFLRQIDLPCVHSKMVESYRGLLSELLDLALPKDWIDFNATGNNGFCRRYGFLEKPNRIRFRILDSKVSLISQEGDQDITITANAFAKLDLSITKVFITENEVNFLAFPPLPDSMVLFGAGYGFDNLVDAQWLKNKNLYYWGDIDTHGFAILSQLRGVLPNAISLFMDEKTLKSHKLLWGKEDKPEKKNLTQLSEAELQLYDDLRLNRLGENVRLEQERIGYQYILDVLVNL